MRTRGKGLDDLASAFPPASPSFPSRSSGRTSAHDFRTRLSSAEGQGDLTRGDSAVAAFGYDRLQQPGRSMRPRGKFLQVAFPRAVGKRAVSKVPRPLSYLCKNGVILGTEHQNHFGRSLPSPGRPCSTQGSERRRAELVRGHIALAPTGPGLQFGSASCSHPCLFLFISRVRAWTVADKRPRFKVTSPTETSNQPIMGCSTDGQANTEGPVAALSSLLPLRS